MTQRLSTPYFIIVLAVFLLFAMPASAKRFPAESISSVSTMELFKEVGTMNKSSPSYNVFSIAMKGFKNLSMSDNRIKKNILTIIDYSKSSNEKRLWVINLDTREVLFHDYVAHGRNSGNEFARRFSDTPDSNMSSIGFYLAEETYKGSHGLSLRLDGVDKSFNENARDRDIVMHGADYVSDAFIKKYGRLGRSLGCPSVSMEIYQQLIDTIQGGSLLFIYYPDKDYEKESTVLNPGRR